MSGTRRSGGSSSGGGGGTNNNRTSRSSSSSNRNSGGGGGGGGSNNTNNDNNDDDGMTRVMPPELSDLMMRLMMSGGVGLGGADRNGPEALTKPLPVKCPTCNLEREYAPALAVGPMKHRYSHNARVLWMSAKCPICIEDKDPPVVNLMCGHVLCLEHFERLNGKVGEDAMLSVADQLAKEREELRNRRSENGNDDTGALFQSFMRSGMMPVAAMRGGNGPGGGGAVPPGRGHSFQFLPDSDHLMDLVMRDFGNHGDDDEDDDDDEEQYDDDDDDDDDEDDSDYDDMPPLIPNARQTAAASTGSRTTANNSSSSRVTNPRRGAAAAVSNNSHSHRSAASNATSNNTGNASNNNDGESSSDDDSMPGLVPRREANSNNNTNRPAPRQQPSPPPPGDDSSDDSEMPPLAPRGNTNRGTANDDDTSSSDSEGVPDLLDPNENDDTSDGEEEEDDNDDDDDEEMPDLVPRDIEAEDSDGSDDDIPELLPRGQEEDDDSASDDDDEDRNISSSDDERDMPGLTGRGAEARPRANNRNRRRRPNTGDSSDDSDDESIPGLIPRSAVETSGVRNPNGNFDPDDSSNDGDSMPGLLYRDVDSADEEESPPPAAARVVPTREMIEQWSAEEMAQGRRMKPGELKRKLRSMNVDTAMFFEKPELVRAYVEQMVQRRVDNYVPSPAEVRAAASAAAAPPPVVDPYADMPPLILAEDPPPKHGIWLLSPASSSSGSRHDDRVVLHYAFVQASRVKSVQRGFFPKGSIILSAKPGLCWIYAPPTTPATGRSNPGVAAAASAASTTTGTNNNSWELFAVRDVNLTVQMFTFEWPGADEASLVADGRGAAYVLLPTDPNNATTCDRTLIRINSQYEDGKNILQQLVPRHSHLYRDQAGGVYIHVPNHNNGGVTTRTNEDSERLSPGIWYITPFQVTCLVSHVSPDAKINLDGNRTGLLLLSPMEGNDGDDDVDSSLLVHVGPSGELHRRIIPVNLTKVAAVLDDGERGALIHCRNSDNRWKLCRAAWEEVNEKGKVNAPLVEFVDCPGRTKLVTDGRGGVWIWKKVGKRNNRAVSYISREGELTESVESFPGGAVMEG